MTYEKIRHVCSEWVPVTEALSFECRTFTSSSAANQSLPASSAHLAVTGQLRILWLRLLKWLLPSLLTLSVTRTSCMTVSSTPIGVLPFVSPSFDLLCMLCLGTGKIGGPPCIGITSAETLLVTPGKGAVATFVFNSDGQSSHSGRHLFSWKVS